MKRKLASKNRHPKSNEHVQTKNESKYLKLSFSRGSGVCLIKNVKRIVWHFGIGVKLEMGNFDNEGDIIYH